MIAGDHDRADSRSPRHRDRLARLLARRIHHADQPGEHQVLFEPLVRPRLVLLDEWPLGLAPLVTREVFDRVGQLVHETGTAVLVVEQNANLALTFASRGYVLDAGTIVSSGTSQQLQGDESIRKAYLGA